MTNCTEFIKEKFPWFLHVFDAYPYNIQRADVIRYFALAYYGGTYLDLDLVPLCILHPLLTSVRDVTDVWTRCERILAGCGVHVQLEFPMILWAVLPIILSIFGLSKN